MCRDTFTFYLYFSLPTGHINFAHVDLLSCCQGKNDIYARCKTTMMLGSSGPQLCVRCEIGLLVHVLSCLLMFSSDKIAVKVFFSSSPHVLPWCIFAPFLFLLLFFKLSSSVIGLNVQTVQNMLLM